MLESLITSKTRIKLIIKFFINSDTTTYLRNLSEEFGACTNGIRQELNRFENVKLLELKQNKTKKLPSKRKASIFLRYASPAVKICWH